MSRIIVKNLPKKSVEENIRTFFSKVGPITDVKLKYKKGEFRGFCFIGYENDEDADNAVKHFQNAFFKQNKISVELVNSLNNDTASFKRKTNKEIEAAFTSSFNDYKESNSQKELSLSKNNSENADDPNFLEYKKLNKKSSLTDPNAEHVQENASEKVAETDDDEDKIATKNYISDLEYLQKLKDSSSQTIEPKRGPEKNEKWVELHTAVIRISENVTRKDKKGKILTKPSVKQFMKPLKARSLRIPRYDTSVAFVGFKTEKELNQALTKDMSFIDGVRVKVQKHHEREEEDENFKTGIPPWASAVERLKEADPVAETGKLYIRNLWYSVTEEDLKEFFEKIGPVADVTIPICRTTRKSKGFAHLSYVFPEHAVRAMNELDGRSFKGRVLHILPSLKKDVDNEDSKDTSFKDKKLNDKKKSASSWHNWNSLFMSSDAVVELMALKYGLSKQEILDNEGDQSAAVNLALGEAQLVEECKKFLISAGVHLEVFSDPSFERSNQIILVKNLAANTKASELKEIFGKYGELGRVVLPPSGATGLIEYLNLAEAKVAFRMLAYSKFKYLPLYLEWAPVKTFTTKKPKSAPLETPTAEKYNINSMETAQEEEPEENATLYVKNLNFKTTDESLREHFSNAGKVHTILIAKKGKLSQGYGFVQFFEVKSAKKALRNLQDSCLDDHNLQLKMTEKKLTEQTTKRKLQNFGKQQSSKILVRNIPFHATRKEIMQLFKTFGELKLVRLPLKPGEQEHRGFGFVEFVTKEDAKKAFEGLCSSTHLYGRKLILEWAKDDETVEELRRKTADHFLSGNVSRGPPTKKSRLDVDNILPEEES